MFKTLKPSQLKPDPRNANQCSPEIEEKIRSNMAKSGFCPALMVRKSGKYYTIIDGHHRLKVAKKLGWTELPCQIVEANEDEAGLLLLTLNRLRGEDNLQKRAVLIQDLLSTFDKTTLSQLIPESETDIDELLTLLSFEADKVKEQIKQLFEQQEGNLPVTFTFLMPKEKAEIVQSALDAFNQPDRSDSLYEICSHYLNQPKKAKPHA